MISTTGTELKEFFQTGIPAGLIVDGEILIVDNKPYDGPINQIRDLAAVLLEGGTVSKINHKGFLTTEDSVPLEDFFLEWRRRQGLVHMAVAVPEEWVKKVREYVRQVGGYVR